ncbi:Vitamin B12 import ATP-binding protein BtuD [subsurface metagenome]
MLKLEGIHVYYEESRAVSDVSISVKEGEFVTIIGANGAGKTTIMKAIMGLIGVRKGKIYFKGTDLTNKPPKNWSIYYKKQASFKTKFRKGFFSFSQTRRKGKAISSYYERRRTTDVSYCQGDDVKSQTPPY